MRHATCFVLLALSLALLVVPASGQEFPHNIVGYYTSWSIYGRNYHVPDIPADRINHINYAFANIAGGEIVLGDHYADVDRYYEGDSWHPDSLRGSFHQLQILKGANPHLRTLISVGGWTWSTYFSDVALTAESRALFASSCVDFILRYGFDGVDIDWEYPVSGGLPGNIYRPEDKQNYTLLLAELRTQLDAAGDYLLTIAAPASPIIMDNIEVSLIHQYLDWINLMTYDYHGPWQGAPDPVTNFNTALHAPSDDPLPEPYHSHFNLAATVDNYLAAGVPRDKLQPGLAFYGRGFGNVANYNNGLYATYSGPAPGGTWENGVFDYWDLQQNYIDLNGYTAYWHPEAEVPWLHNPATQIMISYDDPVSIAAKCAFASARDLGGVMFWEFSADRYAELLDTAYQTLLETAALDSFNDSPSSDRRPTLSLSPGFPNPFLLATTIRFELAEPGRVVADIFDVQGVHVRSLADDRRAVGSHLLHWDGRDMSGKAVGSGVYLCRLQASGDVQQRKLVLLK